MRYFKLLIFILCIYGCSEKNKKIQIQNNDYIIDTTLQIEYIDDASFERFQMKYNNSVEIREEDAFNIACEAIKKMQNHGIKLHLPLRMHLVNDSIWIIRNEPIPSKGNEIFFGNSVYLEIRKMDGLILKGIIEE